MLDTTDKTYVQTENIEGKTILNIDSGYEETTIVFTDDTYTTINKGVGNTMDI